MLESLRQYAATVMLYGLAWTALSGCTTLVHARGEWATPVLPPMPAAPLAGHAVGVRCGQGTSDAVAWESATLRGCQELVRLVRAMGAVVHAAPGLMPPPAPRAAAEVVADEALDAVGAGGQSGNQPQVAFTITYIERGNSTDGCWWTLPLVVMSLSLFPCYIDRPTQAEIRLAGSDGAVTISKQLQLQARTVIGLAAFYYMRPQTLFFDASQSQRRRQNSQLFLGYLRGLIYTFAQRQELPPGPPAGGAA